MRSIRTQEERSINLELNSISHRSIDAESRRTASRHNSIIRSNNQSINLRIPHSLKEARWSLIPSFRSGLRPVTRPHVFEESIIDIVSRRISGSKPHHRISDDFEEHLRKLGENPLADVYHQLCDDPGTIWQGILSCRLLDTTYLDKSLQGFFKIVDYTGSVSDVFARTAQHLQNSKDDINTVPVCSIIINDSKSQKIFSVLNLFAASAYPDSIFFALALSAYVYHWADCLDEDEVKKIIKSNLVSKGEPIVLETYELPSKKPQLLDLSSGIFEHTFKWAYEAPIFNTVSYTTRIPYKSEPVFEKIQMLARRDDNGAWVVTLLLTNQRIFDGFEVHLKFVYDKLRQTIPSVTNISSMGLVHVYAVIFAIHEQMNAELAEFLKKVNIEARLMAVETREHPGRSKILHMFVLEDYTKMSKHFLQGSLDHLSGLRLTDCPPAFQELKESLENDTRFLILGLNQTYQKLRETQSQMRAFYDIKSAQTASIMALLVAVYVPLAGVAGYLGMNTTGIVSGQVDTNVFWQSAIPLMFGTILLPLSATVIARLTVAASFSTRIFTLRNWPVIVDTCLVSTIIAVVVAHIIHWRTKTDRYFIRFFDPVSPHEGVIVNSILGFLEFLKTLENCFLRNKRAKKWVLLFLSCFLVCIACGALSVIDSRGVATIVAPIVWIICVSALLRPVLSVLGVM